MRAVEVETAVEGTAEMARAREVVAEVVAGRGAEARAVEVETAVEGTAEMAMAAEVVALAAEAAEWLMDGRG